MTKPTKSPASYFSSDIIQIIVGLERQIFNVHKDLIYARIPRFQTAFKTCFRENEQSKIAFLDEKPEVFELLLRWVYNTTIVGSDWENTDDEVVLVELYVLANKLCVESLKNSIVDVFYHRSKRRYATSYLITVLRLHGLIKCQLRTLLLSVIAKDIDYQGLEEYRIEDNDHTLAAFIQAGGDDVAELLARLKVYLRGENEDRLVPITLCQFHEHKATLPCAVLPKAQGSEDGHCDQREVSCLCLWCRQSSEALSLK